LNSILNSASQFSFINSSIASDSVEIGRAYIKSATKTNNDSTRSVYNATTNTFHNYNNTFRKKDISESQISNIDKKSSLTTIQNQDQSLFRSFHQIKSNVKQILQHNKDKDTISQEFNYKFDYKLANRIIQHFKKITQTLNEYIMK